MRELDKVIEAYIDEKIQPWNLTMHPNSVLILALKAMIGIKEEGVNSGALVTSIQDTVGGPDHWAWCMSIQQTGVAYVEKKMIQTCSLYASEHCLTVLNNERAKRRVHVNPFIGALAIWRLGKTTNGHVGLVTDVVGERIVCIEGNTGGGDGVNRDGDGVYEKVRWPQSGGAMRIAGYVELKWTPREYAVPSWPPN